MMGRILVVRLGAMGDLLHAMPAVATVRASFPQARISWLVEPRWAMLLEGNPDIDERVIFDRTSARAILESAQRLRAGRFDCAIDFQGLLKSAVAARISGAAVRWGLSRDAAREPAADLLYTDTATPAARHIVDRHLELAEAAGAGVRTIAFRIPPGHPEGCLPEEPFVLASPLAGWGHKQWPLERYAELAARLEHPLVLNGPPGSEQQLLQAGGTRVHLSGLAGLIDATRRAVAVIGVDSGPLHLAAALGKPGVAIFGPTDPERNGPYGGSIAVLRSPDAATTYKRLAEPAPSMLAIGAGQVLEALRERLSWCR